jgi:hypothetical protein
MSSPKAGKVVKRASGTPRHLISRNPASDEGMSGQDKANFIKAMMEGVKTKAGKDPREKAPRAEKPKKVEILRKIPAAPKAVVRASNPLSDEAIALSRTLEGKIAEADFDALTPEAMQALMTVLAKIYAANVEAGNKYPVVGNRMAISGTEAMILCGALLKAVDLQVFELGMWQSWSGL